MINYRKNISDVNDANFNVPGLILRAFLLLVDLAKGEVFEEPVTVKEEPDSDYQIQLVEPCTVNSGSDSDDDESYLPIFPSLPPSPEPEPENSKKRLRSSRLTRVTSRKTPSSKKPKKLKVEVGLNFPLEKKPSRSDLPVPNTLPASYMTPKLMKITADQTQIQQNNQQISVLFHFDIDGIVYGGRKEAMYKGKDQLTVMYLRCVNHNRNTTDCKWKCRLRVKDTQAKVGSAEYCDTENYDSITNLKTVDHSQKCKALSKLRMDCDLAPEFHVSELKRFKQNRTILSLEQKIEIIRHNRQHGSSLNQMASYFSDVYDKKINRQLVSSKFCCDVNAIKYTLSCTEK